MFKQRHIDKEGLPPPCGGGDTPSIYNFGETCAEIPCLWDVISKILHSELTWLVLISYHSTFPFLSQASQPSLLCIEGYSFAIFATVLDIKRQLSGSNLVVRVSLRAARVLWSRVQKNSEKRGLTSYDLQVDSACEVVRLILGRVALGIGWYVPTLSCLSYSLSCCLSLLQRGQVSVVEASRGVLSSPWDVDLW